MIDWFTLLAALSMGLLGGAHCLGMCGGIVGALTMAVDTNDTARRWLLLMLYNVGRIFSYVVLSILFFSLVHSVESYFALDFMRYVAGLLLVAMGLYVANWWQGLLYVEKAGGFIWRLIQPLSKPLFPVNKNWQAVSLGMVWGWLPCGLIYSALAYSATAASVSGAAMIMLSFALGTLPAILLSGLLAERLMILIKHKVTRSLMALLLIAFGLWTLLSNHIPH